MPTIEQVAVKKTGRKHSRDCINSVLGMGTRALGGDDGAEGRGDRNIEARRINGMENREREREGDKRWERERERKREG